MGLSVNAECLQAAQIQLLGVARVRLHDDLKLSVALHSVGVVAVPAVIWPHRRLWVAHVPRLRSSYSKECGWIHCTSTYLQHVTLLLKRKKERNILQ